ncbi:MAG: efflux RND transporter periplasmic adaptor subunit [Gemmataceae bacterium]
MKRFLIPTLIVVSTLTGCGRRGAGKHHLPEVERLPRLETITLGKPTRLEVIHSYTATIEAFEKADVCVMVKGYVKEIAADIDIGKEVKKGDELLRLHVPDLVTERDNKKALLEQSQKAEALAEQAIEVAAAEVKEAQTLLERYTAEWEFRKAQHTRVSRLALADTLSQQQLDEAKLQMNAAAAAVSAAGAQIVTKQTRHAAAQKDRQVAAAKTKVAQAELERAAVNVDFATLRAPFNGVITKRWVDSGATIKDAGMPLFTILRTDKVRVLFDVPERDVPYLKAGPDGSKAVVTIPVLREFLNGEKIEHNVTLLAAALDPVTRTMRTEVHLVNDIAGRKGILKPQMTGTVHVLLAAREAYTVPASALVAAGGKTEIYIVAEPAGDPPRGAVKRVEVQVGLDDGLRVEIKSDRLTGRELVIAKGAGILRPGDEVIAVGR